MPETFVATQRTANLYNAFVARMKIVGTKIYIVWYGPDESGLNQIWKAEMNLDGTGWVQTKITSSLFNKTEPSFDVSDSKIYYAWSEKDSSNIDQIWTAETNLDGSGLMAIKRTNATEYYRKGTQVLISGSKVYYCWWDTVTGLGGFPNNEIITAEMNLDGTGWSSTQRTIADYNDKSTPFMQIMNAKMYLVFVLGLSFSDDEIITAEMNLDGTGWSSTQRTNNLYTKRSPTLYVSGSKIYYAWQERDNSDIYQIWTAEMNLDGTGWSSTQRTNNSYHSYTPVVKVSGAKMYYVWSEVDSIGKYQIWTAEMNLDGTGWSSTQRTISPYGAYTPQFEVAGTLHRLAWGEGDSSGIRQIWTGELDTPLMDTGSGVDTVAIVFTGFGASDYGTGTDTVSLSAVIPVSDAGVGTEGLSLSAIISLLEQGVGIDLASLFMSASDSGQGTENISLNASVTIEDSGEGTESLSEAKAFFYVSEDGVLSPLNVKVTRDSKKGVLSGIEHFTEEVPGRHGEYIFGHRLRGRVIELTVVSEEEFTIDQREQIKRQIAQYLNPLKGEQPLVFADDPEKTYYVKYAGKIDLNQYPSWLHFTIPFKSSQPYVHGSFLNSHIGSGTIANDGNVETPVTIEIAGPVTNPSVIIGSDTLSYTGTVEAGEALVVDTEKLTVELDGSNVLLNFTGGFPKLQPGDTAVAAASAGTTTFKWRSRWLY